MLQLQSSEVVVQEEAQVEAMELAMVRVAQQELRPSAYRTPVVARGTQGSRGPGEGCHGIVLMSKSASGRRGCGAPSVGWV